MARASWFDDNTNQLLFTQYVDQMASWQDAMADGVIDADELNAQAQRVSDMLRQLEPKLNDPLHEELTQVFYELAVFYGMAQAHDIAGELADEESE